jgi:predicted O-linked N-acetylglucosamine transferase (SPINDLY family)
MKDGMTETQSAQGLLLAGRYAEALAAFEIALASRPGDAEALFGRATALKLMGRLDEAHAGYDAVLTKMPGAPGALNNRGEVLLGLDRPDEALADFERALSLKPDFTPARLGRGIALQRLNRQADALEEFNRTLAVWSDSEDGFFHRALALAALGDSEAAVRDYDQVIALRPDSVAAINNRAALLLNLKRFAEAVRGYRQLEQAMPGNAHSLNGLATVALHSCDWSREAEFREQLAAAVQAGRREIQPGTLLGYSGDPALMLACARNFTKAFPSSKPPGRANPFSGERIKLAYVSANFCSHAMPRLMAGVFERHDRHRFEVIAISFAVDDGSSMRARLKSAFDQFHDVRLCGERQIAGRIADLKVDIAVDLMGHTLDARTGIFALRPAPVQVNYMGYPGTLGTNFYDAIIADAIVAPLAQQPFYSEKIVQLPDTYWTTDDRRPEPGPAPSRAQAGLPAGGFVFCCFNNNWKITAALFDIWMRLLKGVPDSVLWLLKDNEEAAARLCREAASRGVEPERLVFAPRVSPEEHLARHRLADLFLDTLPYNAHTTASDALWVGVPLVTLMGESFQGRVAASILSAIGLSELIAETPENYESLALALATDGPRLAALREKLAAKRKTAPLFDTARFTHNLEAAYEAMRENFLKTH